MSVERLYYVEPDRQAFDAVVTGVEESGGRRLVRLDRTAFYPTSGGQPFDTGALDTATVVDVFDETDGPDGDVIHVVTGGALAPGQRVTGSVDWPRRFDHMQQHTGQHMLSAAFDTLFRAATVSFHMGGDVSTIDLARDVALEQLSAAERESNRVIWENRPVTIRFVTDAEIDALPLRKPPKKSGTIRLVEIDGWDLSACGGTHVSRTGAVGMIAISGWERFKGGTRVEFVCGGRALTRFNGLRDAATAASRVLSTSVADIPHGIERLLDENKSQRRRIVALQGELATYQGKALAEQAERTPVGGLVLKVVDSDAAGLKALASAVTAHPSIAAVLVSTSSPALVVVARSSDLATRANEVLAGLIAKFGGKGGGKADLAQGGGLRGTAAEILEEAAKYLRI